MKIKSYIFLIISLVISVGYINAAGFNFSDEKDFNQIKGEIKMANEENKVTFKSTDVFSDSVLSRHFGHGEYQLDRKDALRLQKSGKGQIIKNNGKPDEKASSEVENDDSDKDVIVNDESMNPGDGDITKLVNPTDGTQTDEDSEKGDEIPENFPHRDELIKAGIDTMDKLMNQSGDSLSKEHKFSKAKVTKIGLALSEIEKEKSPNENK